MLELCAQIARAAPTATTRATANSAHREEVVGSTDRRGSAGSSPKRCVNGETSVPAPTAKPVPVKYPSIDSAALGR